ncbi:hypothetical protein ILP97_00480 [Amycolatopsis sp. H6(2020)]|nr:hypothetical protein [Amycolatopsis sp. H6(2020)]
MLADEGTPVDTCFQVSLDVVVTAWHVVNDLGRSSEHDTVGIDALNGATGPATAPFLRVDPLHDVAVLQVDVPLPEPVAGRSATDWAELL